MNVLGTVVRLQVQRSPLKLGERGARVYDPGPLLEVTAVDVGPRGVVGITEDGSALDVHHADHPDTRNARLANGLSLLPRAHYTRLRQTYGPHLIDGMAGESLLFDTDGPWRIEDLAGELELETSDGGWLRLTDAVVAAPCVEFSRFCLAGPGSVEAAISDLSDGVRGFYVRAAGTGRVQAGARLRHSPEQPA